MSRQNNVRLLRTAEILENACKSRKEGEIGVYGIAVLSFFSCGISEVLILMNGIAVSSSPAVCCFSLFWLTVFDKRRSFTVLAYRFTGGKKNFYEINANVDSTVRS